MEGSSGAEEEGSGGTNDDESRGLDDQDDQTLHQSRSSSSGRYVSICSLW